jgi:hypothetical protein
VLYTNEQKQKKEIKIKISQSFPNGKIYYLQINKFIPMSEQRNGGRKRTL